MTSISRDRAAGTGYGLGLLALLAQGLVPACTGSVKSGYPSGDDTSALTTGAPPAGGSAGAATEGTASDSSSSSTTLAAGGSGGATPVETTVLGEFTRLTRAEYLATVVQALGVTPDVNLIPEDGRVGRFTSNQEVTPDPVHPYLLAAEELAALAVPDHLPACDPSDPNRCVEEEYAAALSALFRRELTSADTETFGAVLEAVAAGGGSADEATRAMLAAALLSPDFLYRASPSLGDGAQASVGRRLAERLSFAVWDSPPDPELTRNLSESETLGEAVVAEAARVSRDARAVPVLARFFGQWLDVDTDLRLEDPDFETSPHYLELLAFVERAVANEAPVREFVGGRDGVAHRDNLELYALGEGEGSGEVVSLTWAADSSRRGLLGQELLAGSTRHPDLSRREIFRGLLVRRSLLCDEIPAPDPELIALAGEVENRTEDGRCRNCHLRLDPIGRAFADLDPDNDAPVPAPEVLFHDELEGSYASAGELLEAVAQSRAFAECFAKHWLAFFLERPLGDIDAAWILLLADQVQNGASLGDVVEQTLAELHERSLSFVPWCEGS